MVCLQAVVAESQAMVAELKVGVSCCLSVWMREGGAVRVSEGCGR